MNNQWGKIGLDLSEMSPKENYTPLVYNSLGELFLISSLPSTASLLTRKRFSLGSPGNHTRTWEQNSRISREQGGMPFGTLLTYRGKLKEGSETGEMVGQSH